MADENEAVRPRRPDVLTLLAGLATLLVAAFVLTDGRVWLPSFDLRWVLAGGAVLVGLLFLGASVKGKRNR